MTITFKVLFVNISNKETNKVEVTAKGKIRTATLPKIQRLKICTVSLQDDCQLQQPQISSQKEGHPHANSLWIYLDGNFYKCLKNYTVLTKMGKEG